MKGTFLNPQYLQCQDRFLEDALQFNLESLAFRPWGLREIRIDREALSGGYFSLSGASGIFPDGLLFEIPSSDPAPPPKPMADYFEADQESSTVYLAVPHYSARGMNVSLAGGEADTRYQSEVLMVRDENSGKAERPVQVARKNLRLLMDGESRRTCSAIPVARVNRTAAGGFELDAHFVPPLLDIAASDYLVALARRMVEILAAKSSQLSGTRRQRNLSLAEFGTSDIANFWLLYNINSHFPLFQHVFETRRGHPEHLYRLLLSLGGALTTFSLEIHPRDFPVYDHEDLGGCFSKLDEQVRTLLETVVPSNFVSLPLKFVEAQIYGTSLADEKYLTNTKMYLAVAAEMNEGELISKVPFLVKVCSADHIQHLVRQALPGVTLTHVVKPPSSIPVKLSWQYFSLNQSGVAWEAICRARNLAAYIPGDFPAPQAELVILLPEAQ